MLHQGGETYNYQEPLHVCVDVHVAIFACVCQCVCGEGVCGEGVCGEGVCGGECVWGGRWVAECACGCTCVCGRVCVCASVRVCT